MVQEVQTTTAASGGSAWADTLVRWIRDKKLEAPATLFLEMHRPLMPLAHPAAILCGTVVAPFFGPDYYEQIEALRDPAVLDTLLDKLAGRTGESSRADTPA